MIVIGESRREDVAIDAREVCGVGKDLLLTSEADAETTVPIGEVVATPEDISSRPIQIYTGEDDK